MSESKGAVTQQPPQPNPLIPERILDVPSQRLYYLSLGLLCQSIKAFDFFQYLFFSGADPSTTYTGKWVLVDILYCLCLAQLRIPRLNYPKSVVSLQILSLCLLDAFLFGGITVNLGLGSWGVAVPFGITPRPNIPSTGPSFSIIDLIPGFGSSNGKDSHILGQHTVRMSPISTAQLNPNSETFCIPDDGQSILIPVLLNNTNPTSVRYTLTPLGFVQTQADKEKKVASTPGLGRVERFELGAKDLKAIESTRLELLEAARAVVSNSQDSDDYDEYDDEDEDEDPQSARSSSVLQRTQTMAHLRVHKPGVLSLDRILDSSNIEARLVYPTELTIAPCPRAAFVNDGVISQEGDVRCAHPGLASGAGEELNLKIDIFGVPPLSLRWLKETTAKREPFMVEGIEGDTFSHRQAHEEGRRAPGTGFKVPQHLTVPLTVSLDSVGDHSYILESVTDGLGNVVPVKGDHVKTRRSTRVLRRPAVSFQNCAPGKPAPLLIGSTSPLKVGIQRYDADDFPWNVSITYQPPEDEVPSTSAKRLKPWTRVFTTFEAPRLDIAAETPGDYSIVGLKGQHCEGDVLSPDVCKVVERPYPTAEMVWKKIHECSGDIGVSASLVLHGTAPFQVYYSIQRDNEPPKELVKTFSNSRGEFTIQPERSGHYTFAFLHLSDANYKKIALKGPSIDQIVHPPASVDFYPPATAAGRSRRRISSCSGSFVSVKADFKGTGPWNLELQTVGPKGSDTIKETNISDPRKTLLVPIPKVVDRDGGSFEIDLVSVEDAYGCKRPVSVPGLTVNVKRVKPTAKFYGTESQRHITILEGEHAKLPMRLTGDGPWRLKYRRTEDPEAVETALLSSANDELHVSKRGHYEIIGVSDSQCPGTVDAAGATYLVDWIGKPVARLSSQIQATYESSNNSYILPPICEGAHDHVDLDLTGRPPFQIMYNVARDGEQGTTKIIDQPTFSSIQPRTRFQLHTSEAAQIYYEVKQIGDAAYPLSKHKNAVIPRSDRLLFEQQVLMRPSARFKNQHRMSYCMNDVFSPQDPSNIDGLVVLEGTPPFQLEVSIKNLAASETHMETIELRDYAWKLDLPSYKFKSIGPHLVTIESIQDASHCEQTAPNPLLRSIWVDVAETAAIVPFDRREHFCVGDVTQFQLEGIPPWTVGYRVNNKASVQEVKTSPFSIVQEQAGDFVVTSIAHQHKKCKTAVTDLRYVVHSLPAAQVGHGKRIIQDIHEGDQAEILFTLVGEPPFTFTYQRTELTSKKGVQGKVLETHTVSGVTANQYSIFSALEGTWTITSISDRYCRYPPAQSDMTVEKAKRR